MIQICNIPTRNETGAEYVMRSTTGQVKRDGNTFGPWGNSCMAVSEEMMIHRIIGHFLMEQSNESLFILAGQVMWHVLP